MHVVPVRGRLEAVDEQPLPGGFATTVIRIGDTVRRTPAPGAPFVRALLDFFEQRGWEGAPRFLGTDEQGREVLSYIDGHVAWQADQPAEVYSSASLAQVARLVRQFHDQTAGTPLAADQEVVCHNDLSPKNTVYRDTGAGLRPVAFLDWDLAAPGARIHDVAFVCWQYLDLGLGSTDAAQAARAMRLICDAYGLADRDDLIGTVLWWQDRCLRGMETQAAAGDPAMIRLLEAGVPGSVREAARWVAENRAELAAGIG
jgi:Phosphotransferase enzyme family